MALCRQALFVTLTSGQVGPKFPAAAPRRAPFDLHIHPLIIEWRTNHQSVGLFYPFYTQDTLLEVSDEVAQAMAEAERLERNYICRMFYNKAQYSLDADDGIEASVTECHILSPEAVLDLMERYCRLCRALNELPELQGRRVEAHYLLGKSVQEIAKEEGRRVKYSKNHSAWIRGNEKNFKKVGLTRNRNGLFISAND